MTGIPATKERAEREESFRSSFTRADLRLLVVNRPDGGKETVRLLFTSVTWLPLKANRFSPAWLAARKAAGLEGGELPPAQAHLRLAPDRPERLA
jgi:hypothetical protein